MFPALNKELNFGLRQTGSMVLAFSEKDREVLVHVKVNGERNGVMNLRIIEKDEILRLEPHVNKNVSSNIPLLCPRSIEYRNCLFSVHID